eukprot:TRINITY_DN1899_c0_g2_i5.p1 TRINITY_DN1899_c0_g2~~TRINITY_DN1899_c0_g2_i5.p1  ORF type:complete len:143 (-),score=31.38 TRINITY_DN1899_c0_g2_i5:518-946(-)
MAVSSFKILANFSDSESQTNKPLIETEAYLAIQEFLSTKSSVSGIHYFPLQISKEVCDEHTDTGLLTFITKTHQPSLELWDRMVDRYAKIEQMVEEDCVVVFLGEKIPLFSQNKSWKATPHRVRMEPGPGHISIAFLLDIAK